ncbi:hypothetical protein DNHGIG_40220 [Collibacillus ludicampi]|uniref:Uncharacterized protein n=1 Tax=Collibacillus ludicampi TaxID=2771369 RepID=A0AAV4LKY3_9BACL|nr:hypothetical protein DNHGIG_40220 [Collibacillus ludicampi]
MRISEAFLHIIREANGEIHHTQFRKWEAQLHQAGLIEYVWKGEEGSKDCYIRLTEKGRSRLQKINV